jgi:hypothetical protein
MRATHIAVDANVRAASEDDAMPAHGVVVVVTLEVMSLCKKKIVEEQEEEGGKMNGWGRRIADAGNTCYPRERIWGSFKSLVRGRFGYRA